MIKREKDRVISACHSWASYLLSQWRPPSNLRPGVQPCFQPGIVFDSVELNDGEMEDLMRTMGRLAGQKNDRPFYVMQSYYYTAKKEKQKDPKAFTMRSLNLRPSTFYENMSLAHEFILRDYLYGKAEQNYCD